MSGGIVLPKDLSPLAPIANDTQRGHTVEIAPGQGSVLITGFNSLCPRGELIGVVLGICPIDAQRGRFDPDADVPPDEPLDAFAAPAVRAEITWGIGSASFFAVADFLHGTVLGLVAENIRVCASYVTLGCCPDRKHLPCFAVSAGFGYAARSANSNPARLTKHVRVPAGQSKRIRVPPFALSLTGLPIESRPFDLRVLGGCGSLGVTYHVAAPLSNVGMHLVENALPLFNGARFVDVFNPGPDELEALILFGLSL